MSDSNGNEVYCQGCGQTWPSYQAYSIHQCRDCNFGYTPQQDISTPTYITQILYTLEQIRREAQSHHEQITALLIKISEIIE